MRTRVCVGYCLLLLVAVMPACQTDSRRYVLTPTITIYTEKPDQTAPAATIPVSAPPDMVFVPGGFTQMGADDGPDGEKPVLWAEVAPFFLDQHPVTVAEFRRFVQATGYRTQAETFGDAGVLDEGAKSWTLKKGADWSYPLGRDRSRVPDNHPVTQVSWNDVNAYATWAGKRLPAEFEWEHAARNAVNSRTRYPFGNALQTTNGVFLSNTWNGTFPEQDAVLDGFHYTSPVGHYGKTPLGLVDMTGNVWQWCEDWRQTYRDVAESKAPVNPTEKVQRGGSFLCEPGWCHGYRVSGRSFASPETALMHVGFRCAKSL